MRRWRYDVLGLAVVALFIVGAISGVLVAAACVLAFACLWGLAERFL